MRMLGQAAFFLALAFALLLNPAVAAAARGAQNSGATKGPAILRKLTLLGVGSDVELEITTSEVIVPQTQVVADPDRLVLDFPNCQPAPELHNFPVDRGSVRGVRVSLFLARPAVTRVVVDLSGIPQYQMFPANKTVVVKFQASPAGPGSVPVAPATALPPPVVSTDDMPATLPPRPSPRLEVSFEGGLLRISADKATLAEVLAEVRARTGAEITIPPEAKQDRVFTNLGPGPAKDVLASLLNGSRFNFIVVGSGGADGQLSRVVLIPKDGEGETVPVGDYAGSPAEAPEPAAAVSEGPGTTEPDPAEVPNPDPTQPPTPEVTPPAASPTPAPPPPPS
jgi:hypothetical protein